MIGERGSAPEGGDAAVERELDAHIDAITSIAASALVLHDEAGPSADAVIRRSEYDAVTRAKLEGAVIGVRYALGRSLRTADDASERLGSMDGINGAAVVRANIASMLGEYGVTPRPARDGDIGDEVAIFARCDDAAAALRYLDTAVPRPDREASELMAPIGSLLSSVGGHSAPSGRRAAALSALHGWVPRASAAAFVAFIRRSAPSPATAMSDEREARLLSRSLERALDMPNPAFVGGETVRVSLTAPQARAVKKILIDVSEVVRPMHARRCLVNAWEQADRSKAMSHGTVLGAPLGVMQWARDMLLFAAGEQSLIADVIGNAAARISSAIEEVDP